MKYILVSWCNTGIEHMQDISQYHPDVQQRQNLFDSIQQGQEVGLDFSAIPVAQLELRARFNPQRDYEIYLFTIADELTVEDCRQWGESDPQGFADWVRANNVKCILDHRSKDVKLIS